MSLELLTTESMSWFGVVQCVRTELFPTLAVHISECVQESFEDPNFKMDDIGEDAANNVLGRLRQKRAMNNKEEAYLLALVKRAHDSQKTVES